MLETKVVTTSFPQAIGQLKRVAVEAIKRSQITRNGQADMINAFNHTGFTVENMERALEFWTKGLGFQAAMVGERKGDWQARITGVPGARIKVAHLVGYGHHVHLIQYLNPPVVSFPLQPNLPGAGHICLEVTDIDNTGKRLVSLGGKPQGEMTDITDGPVKGCRALYIRDPDGIIIELLEIGN